MRRTLPLIALLLALLALAACSATGLPVPEAPPVPEATQPAAPEPASQPLPAEYVGVYTASLPAADTPGREVTVELEADGTVSVTSDYLNGQPPIVETGEWSGNPSGTISVQLTAQGDQPYFEPRTFLVGLEGDELLVLGEGGQVTRLARSSGETAAEPAAAAPSSKEAPEVTASEPVTTTTVVTASSGLTTTVVETTQVVTATAPIDATTGITEEITPTNTYVALRPAASAGGTQLVALSLFDDGNAELATEFGGEEAPIVELGTWVDNGDETITVTLTGQPDRQYEEPVVITFQREDDVLQSIDAQDLYGSEGLRLRLEANVVSDISASLITLDLEAGFPLDPTFVSVQAGGEIDASLLASHCAGFVNQQPVVTVNWSGSIPYVETFFFSDSDPTLVVLTPDGQVLCNDDTNKDVLDPTLSITDPVSGTYRIWVGSYAKGQLIPGVLVLTTQPDVNVGTFNLAGLIRRPLVAKVQPEPATAGTREAAMTAISEARDGAATVSGPEPVTASLTVSGTIPLFELDLPDPLCNGLVSGTPDLVFNWAGDSDQFTVLFEGDSDSTLLILSEDAEQLICNDDAEPGANINPLVVVSEPKPGLYGVWVGRLDPTKPVAGTLTITTAADTAPSILAPIQ